MFNGYCRFNHDKIIYTSQGAYISGDSTIAESVNFIGNSTIGNNTTIGENTIIENSIIWDNVKIGSNLHIKDSIIASNCIIKSDLISQILGMNEIYELDTLKSGT